MKPIEETKEFIAGWDAWNDYVDSGWRIKPKNPYPEGSIKAELWLRGWNLNFHGI